MDLLTLLYQRFSEVKQASKEGRKEAASMGGTERASEQKPEKIITTNSARE